MLQFPGADQVSGRGPVNKWVDGLTNDYRRGRSSSRVHAVGEHGAGYRKTSYRGWVARLERCGDGRGAGPKDGATVLCDRRRECRGCRTLARRPRVVGGRRLGRVLSAAREFWRSGAARGGRGRARGDTGTRGARRRADTHHDCTRDNGAHSTAGDPAARPARVAEG